MFSATDYVGLENFKAILRNVEGKISPMSWFWDELTRNKHVSIEIVNQFPKCLWSWSSLSCHPNITWEDIQNNPRISWHWPSISMNPNVTWEIIQNNPNEKWFWKNVAINPNVTDEIINSHPDLFDFTHTAYPPKKSFFNTCTWEEALENKRNWVLYNLSGNPNISIENIKNNPKLLWNWNIVSSRKDLKWEDIKTNLGGVVKKWNWDKVSQNPNITVEIMKNNPQYKWNLNAFVISNGSVEIIKDNPDMNWCKKDHLFVKRIGDKFESEKFREWNSSLKIQRWWRHHFSM